jgi:hypothetical protein
MIKFITLFFLLGTATLTFANPLAGSYTIGGTAPDFTTINAAITALDSNGISAPVVFNIRNGSYPELLIFSPVAGASATNTIIFQGESGDSSLVEINGTTTSNQQNTIRLSQISYLTLKDLTIRQYPNVNNNAVVFVNRGKYCTFSNCVIWGHSSSTSSATEYVIQSCNDSGMVVSKCYLFGSVSGCYFGNPFFSHRNLLVEDCYVGARITVNGGAFVKIRNNTILGRVLLEQTSRSDFHNNFLNSYLQMIASSGWPLQKTKIYNNVILGGSAQGSIAYGFRVASSGNYDFYNNTIYMNTPTMSGYCIYTETSSSGITIKNNIFYRQDTLPTNYIFRYPNAEAYVGNIISDNNLFYRNGTSFSDNYSSLSAFTAGTGLDSNSVYADPSIVVSGIYQLSSYIANAAIVNTIGVPISYINTDIYGNTRHPHHPTIGAFESASNVYCFSSSNDLVTSCNPYLWLNGNVYSSSTNTPTYTMIGGASGGCDSIITLNLTINSVDTSILVGNASFASNATNASYQWLLCNGTTYSPIPNDTSQYFTPPNFNDYYAVAVTQNGCVDTSACYTMLVTESPTLALHKKEGSVTCYPNPAKDILNISMSGSLPIGERWRGAYIAIQNTLGQNVFTKNNCNALETIDVSAFAKGVYFVNSNNHQTKFIKY